MSNKKSTKNRNLPIIRSVIRSLLIDTIYGDIIRTALFVTAFERDRINTTYYRSDTLCGYAVDKSVFESLTEYELNEMFLINPHNNSFTITAFGKRIIRDKGQLIKPRLFNDYYYTEYDVNMCLYKYDLKHGTDYCTLPNFGFKIEPFYGLKVEDEIKDKMHKEDALIYLWSDSCRTDSKTKRLAQLKYFADGSSSANFPIDFVKHFGMTKKQFKAQNSTKYYKGYYIDEI